MDIRLYLDKFFIYMRNLFKYEADPELRQCMRD